jgi:hypothetical protein
LLDLLNEAREFALVEDDPVQNLITIAEQIIVQQKLKKTPSIKS